MRPASARFRAAVRESHQIATAIDVLTDGEVVETITQATVSGTVTLDSRSAVRGRAELVIGLDDDSNLVPVNPGSLLAPYGNEIRVRRGIAYSDGSDELVSLGIFRIDDAAIDDTAMGVSVAITAFDRAQRVIDARFELAGQIASGTNVETAILGLLQGAIPDVATSFPATTYTTPLIVYEEGGDRWQLAQEIATGAGLVLYFDGDGVATLAPPPGGEPDVTLAEGVGGVLISASRKWVRTSAFNRVIATGENTGETAPARGVATDLDPASPTYYFGPFGRVPRFFTSSFIRTDDQATSAATSLLARELGTTEEVGFGTIVNPALEPDDVVRITRLRAGIDEDHVIASLTIPLSATEAMSGQTKARQVTS